MALLRFLNIKKKEYMLYCLLLLLLPITSLFSATVHQTITTESPTQQRLAITIALKEQELLYKNYLSWFTDNPDTTLTLASIEPQPAMIYDSLTKDTHLAYTHSVSLNFILTLNAQATPSSEGIVHIIYMTNQANHPYDEIIPFTFAHPSLPSAAQPQEVLVTQNKEEKVSTQRAVQNTATKTSFTHLISSVVEKTQSTPIRIVLVLLLGILLSLTPCIYPMIPITVGILQTQSSHSLLKSFLLSLLYTCGMATTFACFGLLVSITGPIFGQLLTKPWFIVGLVCLLLYLAGSMLGVYELTMPRFLQPKGSHTASGSYLSIFLLGAASGTFASPCVSPGLALLLSIVATLGNPLLGFLLLFSFGVGLSTPLLIVGTFSSSLSLMPQAGMWMVEIKKIFGFIMIAMCLYYLTFAFPLTLVWIISALVALITGIYYSYSSVKHYAPKWRILFSFLAMCSIALSIVCCFQAYRAFTLHPRVDIKQQWSHNYQEARQQALRENKKLFIDCWAQFCSICLAINKKHFTNAAILDVLNNYYVPLNVDGTSTNNPVYQDILQHFTITGFPTFLIVDPTTEAIMKQYGAELYDMTQEQIMMLLEENK